MGHAFLLEQFNRLPYDPRPQDYPSSGRSLDFVGIRLTPYQLRQVPISLDYSNPHTIQICRRLDRRDSLLKAGKFEYFPERAAPQPGGLLF